MMRVFAPRFTQAMAMRSEHYLPGDAPTLSKDMAQDIGASLTDADEEKGDEDVDELVGFLRLYRQRYLGKSVVGDLDVLEACLLHVLKMPFELASSVQQGLIRCWLYISLCVGWGGIWASLVYCTIYVNND